MAKFGIGQAMTRREDQRLLFGTGQYVDDEALPNEVFVDFVRSPHSHARLVAIDAKSARALPGVVAVLTGADLKADNIGPLPDGAGRRLPLALLASKFAVWKDNFTLQSEPLAAGGR